MFINYNIQTTTDKKYSLPINVIYASFKYYLLTNIKNSNENVLYLHYHCNNHRKKSTINPNNNMCNGQILYNKQEKEFLYYNDHKEEFNASKNIEQINLLDTEKEVSKISNLKTLLTEFLYKNPLITFGQFKEEAFKIKQIEKNKIMLNDNRLKNIYYPFKHNTDIFKWTSLFFNRSIFNIKIYLREYLETYIYDNNKREFYLHRHVIYASTFNINNIIKCKYLYIDCTFIVPENLLNY